MRRIGIDVGGTNTDAVLLDGDKVVFAVKRPTTKDVTSGILDALKALRADPAARGPVDAVVIGTTHFINAAILRLATGPRRRRARRDFHARRRPRL